MTCVVGASTSVIDIAKKLWAQDGLQLLAVLYEMVHRESKRYVSTGLCRYAGICVVLK